MFYPNKAIQELVGYTDAGYLSEPHEAQSQTVFVFTCGGIAITWCSTKQTMVATFSNNTKLLSFHETRKECI